MVRKKCVSGCVLHIKVYCVNLVTKLYKTFLFHLLFELKSEETCKNQVFHLYE